MLSPYANAIKHIIHVAMICPKCILSLTDCCCKKNDGLNKTIDFSDVPRLEPEFI